MQPGARVLVVGVCLVAAACGPRGATSSVANRGGGAAPTAADPDALPADVQALVDRWESCQHWAGEEPYDADRARDIQAGVDQSCPGNDDTRAALEQKYAGRPAVLARLRALDE